MRYVTVREQEIRSTLVNVGVDVVLLGDGSKPSVVKEPDEFLWA
jgi:hypothetical protein